MIGLHRQRGRTALFPKGTFILNNKTSSFFTTETKTASEEAPRPTTNSPEMISPYLEVEKDVVTRTATTTVGEKKNAFAELSRKLKRVPTPEEFERVRRSLRRNYHNDAEGNATGIFMVVFIIAFCQWKFGLFEQEE